MGVGSNPTSDMISILPQISITKEDLNRSYALHIFVAVMYHKHRRKLVGFVVQGSQVRFLDGMFSFHTFKRLSWLAELQNVTGALNLLKVACPIRAVLGAVLNTPGS